MVKATSTNFSHILHSFLTFKNIHCTRIKQPTILDNFYSVLYQVSSNMGGWRGWKVVKMVVLNFKRERHRDALG